MEKQLVTKKPGRKRAENRKEQLVQASLETFLEKGYHPARIEDIVARAQVGKGTFYLYFKGKEEVVEHILGQFIQEIRDTLAWVQESLGEGFESEQGIDLEAIFKEEAKRLIATMLKNQTAGKFLFKEGRAVSTNIDQKISAYYKEMMETSETTFALAMHAKLIPVQHPQVAAMIIIGGISQMFNYWLEGEIEEDFDDLTEHTVSFFVRALGL